MRAILRDPLARRRHGRPRPHARQQHTAHREQQHSDRSRDLAAERVRQAGGPVDRASYTCRCGYVFLASVSTTVACPHCRAPQAW